MRTFIRILSRIELAANDAVDVTLESESVSIENPELSLLLVYTVVRDSEDVKVQPIREVAHTMKTKQRFNKLSDFSIIFQIHFHIL